MYISVGLYVECSKGHISIDFMLLELKMEIPKFLHLFEQRRQLY